MKTERPVTFLARLSEMASSEVVGIIGQSRYDAIRRQDEHPMFVMLRVGYEGVSHGTITIGAQTKHTPKRWFRAAVNELADRLNFGSPGLFAGSHADRDKPERQRRGEVLAGYVRETPSKEAEAIGVAYVKDADTRRKIQTGEYDICSVEGEVVIADLEGQEPYVDAVPSVSGVCLASSADENPGFARAGVEAVINELRSHGGMDEMADKLTGNPSDHFPRNTLAADPVVKALINEGRENVYQDYQREKGRADGLATEVENLKKTNAALEADLKTAGVSKNASRIVKELDAQVSGLKLTQKEKDLIRTRLASRIEVADANADDSAIKAAVEAAVKPEAEYAMEMRKLYGKPPEAGASGKTDDGKTDDGKADNGDAGNDGADNDDPFIKANPLEKE